MASIYSFIGIRISNFSNLLSLRNWSTRTRTERFSAVVTWFVLLLGSSLIVITGCVGSLKLREFKKKLKREKLYRLYHIETSPQKKAQVRRNLTEAPSPKLRLPETVNQKGSTNPADVSEFQILPFEYEQQDQEVKTSPEDRMIGIQITPFDSPHFQLRPREDEPNAWKNELEDKLPKYQENSSP